MKNSGFTILEIILVLAIFAILLVLSFAAFGNFRDDSDLANESNNIQATLRLAQSRTVSSEGDTRYGVYFNEGSTPHEYVLFQSDTDYAARVSAQDVIYQIPPLVQFSSVTFNDLSGNEVVFDRIQGTTSNDGNVVLESTTDVGNTRTISVNGAGSIEVNTGAAPTDADRLKDTRHMHITYAGREITTASETITLDFAPSATTFDIVIIDNLIGGQINWEGTVDVDGEDQVLQVHTHMLNDVGFVTDFSIHRDRRFNTKPLTITISGDGTGKIIEYDASGILVTGGESIYVTTTQEQ